MTIMNEGPAIVAGAHGLSSVEKFEGRRIMFVGKASPDGFKTEAVVARTSVEIDDEREVIIVFRLEGRSEWVVVRGVQIKGWALENRLCGGDVDIEGHFAVKA